MTKQKTKQFLKNSRQTGSIFLSTVCLAGNKIMDWGYKIKIEHILLCKAQNHGTIEERSMSSFATNLTGRQ